MSDATNPNEAGETEVTTVTDDTKTTTNPVTSGENQNGKSSENTNPEWLPARLERERNNAVKDLLKGLGLENAEQIQSALAENQAFKEAQMSEQEKREAEKQSLLDQLEQSKQANATLQQQLKDIETRQRETMRKSALSDALKDTLNPKAITLLIREEYPAEYDGILNEDGTVNSETIKTIIEKASQAHPKLFRVSTSPGSPPSVNRGHTAQAGKMSDEERNKRMRRIF